MKILRAAVEGALSLLYPGVGCAVCGGVDGTQRVDSSDGRGSFQLCDRCVEAYLKGERRCCPRCGRGWGDGAGECPDCRRAPPAFSHCVAVADYAGEIKGAVHRLKYEAERSLAEPLGLLLAARTPPSLADTPVLVPVPLHASRLRDRGFNQAELLAAAVARWLGWPLAGSALVRDRTTPPQAFLNRAERQHNLKGAFRAPPLAGVRGRGIVLVDDVVTTGSTLHECARVLLAAGARRVDGLVVAATAHHATDSYGG